MPHAATLSWYAEHATAFAEATADLDVAAGRARLLDRIVPGATILDAGCGAGRDAAAFAALGHPVTAFDACPALAAIAERRIGSPVLTMRFDEVAFAAVFDAVWANASLLHVPAAEEADALRRLARALRPGGVLAAKWKAGDGEGVDPTGRLFRLHDEGSLRALLARDVPALSPEAFWREDDVRPGATTAWIGMIARRLP